MPLEAVKVSWKIKRDPEHPTLPTFKHPARCANCGHLGTEHISEVGCIVEGGTKYIENENGEGRRVCSCLEYIKIPDVQLEEEEKLNAYRNEQLELIAK